MPLPAPIPAPIPLIPLAQADLEAQIASTWQTQMPVISAFHTLWYGTDDNLTTWQSVAWRGVNVMKCPLDLWMYTELVFERLRPTTIIETGTAHGGSALFFADLCDLMGRGHVLTIDIFDPPKPFAHPRVTTLRGSSIDPDILAQVGRWHADHHDGGPTLISLDSDHTPGHVAQELTVYTLLTRPGDFVVVEDSNVAGGPTAAITDFLAKDPGAWSIDLLCHRFLLTFNPGGWLQRLR